MGCVMDTPAERTDEDGFGSEPRFPQCLEGHTIHGRVTRVIDGDTFQASLQWPRLLNEHYSFICRLNSINAPESTFRAKSDLEKRHGKACASLLSTVLIGHEVTCQTFGIDCWKRLLVSISTDEVKDVASYMLEHSPCQPYDGKRKAPPWTPDQLSAKDDDPVYRKHLHVR